jgi:hypothetical protein
MLQVFKSLLRDNEVELDVGKLVLDGKRVRVELDGIMKDILNVRVPEVINDTMLKWFVDGK